MWWQRRPTRGDRRAPVGAPPARGAWLGLPGWAIAAGIPVVLAVGWALPLFGVPLAVFLVADAIIGTYQRLVADAIIGTYQRLVADPPSGVTRPSRKLNRPPPGPHRRGPGEPRVLPT